MENYKFDLLKERNWSSGQETLAKIVDYTGSGVMRGFAISVYNWDSKNQLETITRVVTSFFQDPEQQLKITVQDHDDTKTASEKFKAIQIAARNLTQLVPLFQIYQADPEKIATLEEAKQELINKMTNSLEKEIDKIQSKTSNESTVHENLSSIQAALKSLSQLTALLQVENADPKKLKKLEQMKEDLMTSTAVVLQTQINKVNDCAEKADLARNNLMGISVAPPPDLDSIKTLVDFIKTFSSYQASNLGKLSELRSELDRSTQDLSNESKTLQNLLTAIRKSSPEFFERESRDRKGNLEKKLDLDHYVSKIDITAIGLCQKFYNPRANDYNRLLDLPAQVKTMS